MGMVKRSYYINKNTCDYEEENNNYAHGLRI